jgi:hypothetical protein
MERQDVAYFVNSTPKYFYLLPLHFTLVKRYAAALKWPIYMATETPNHPEIQDLSKTEGIKIQAIPEKDRFFLESRIAACQALPSNIKYVFPMQEDFLLGGRIDEKAIQEALSIMDDDHNVVSVRLMPCPGPKEGSFRYKSSNFFILREDFMFTFQATLWRREAYQQFIASVCEIPFELFKAQYILSNPAYEGDENHKKKFLQVDFNIAENYIGQNKLIEVLGAKTHLSVARIHKYPNAVMLSPWPYRPTAVEKGKLGEWVYEFAKREGFPIQKPTNS